MPSINIIEQDNTIQQSAILANEAVVYVPGFATSGPTNTPTLFQTYNQFAEAFPITGAVPKDHISWLYAANLLKRGVYVLFDRVYDDEAGASALVDMSTTETTPSVISSIAVAAGGTGYAVDDILTVAGGTGGRVKVTTVADGVVTGISVDAGGYGYSVADDVATSGGTGNGCLVEILSVTTRVTNQFKIQYKYAGSYGNQFSAKVISTGTTTFALVIYKGAEIVERKDISTDSASANYIFTRSFNNVIVTALEAVALTDFSAMVTTKALAGGTDITEAEILDILTNESDNYFSKLNDRSDYNITFLTAGGYTEAIPGTDVYTKIHTNMLLTAGNRGDCVALLDVAFGTNDAEIQPYFSLGGSSSYGAAYAAWGTTQDVITGEIIWMPPSYFMLSALANSLKTNPVYAPPAGVKRGKVSNLINAEYNISGALLNSWQNDPKTDDTLASINPIMPLSQYGYVVYGQGTLLHNLGYGVSSALQSLNVRLAVNYIKKLIYNIVVSLTFDQNTERLWNEFRALVSNALDTVVAGQGIFDYEIVLDEEAAADDSTLPVIVRISPTRAAETFNITLVLGDTSLTINE